MTYRRLRCRFRFVRKSLPAGSRGAPRPATKPVETPPGETVITLTCVQEECELRAVVKYSHSSAEGWRTGVQFLSFPKKWLIMELAVSAMLAGAR